MRELMGKLKLTVNEEKTRICSLPERHFEFLGYMFGRLYSPRTGSSYIGCRPSKKSIRRAIDKVHALTARNMTWQETTDVVAKLNRVLRGWANYFQVGTVSGADRALEHYTAQRLRRWLRYKHQAWHSRAGRFYDSYPYGELGLVRLTARGRDVPWAKA